MENATAQRCIELIQGRIPLNEGEMKLLERIINDIRVEFDLLGAVHPMKLEDGYGEPPKEWIW